ncbi:MAG: molybdenum cofactor biosynthesis protein MoaE [Saprospiraceae bacterium]|nr:molybdenum cofactor biosynthesis protein MoaE [Saprospiraceae bacterium]
MKVDLQVLETPLQIESCTAFVQDISCGGTVVFIGTVRSQTKGRHVIGLEFESYIPMAIKEMKKIAADVGEKWDVKRMCIQHRIGTLDIGEIPVVIAVATPHRAAAFAACQYTIDTLKETVPIWKKEFYADGSIWVSAHP